MTVRPAIFSASMVRGFLREIERPGTGKTMTRRILKPQPDPRSTTFSISSGQWMGIGPSAATGGTAQWDSWRPLRWNVGDRLYVREAWRISKQYDAVKPINLRPRKMTVMFDAGGSIANQAAGSWVPDSWPEMTMPGWAGRRRASMHMPRWASRLTLTVTAVKIEPLNDISDEDAIAEGVTICGEVAPGIVDYHVPDVEHPNKDFPYLSRPTLREMFAALWDVINGSGAWLANPAVVAVTFKPELRNIDAGAQP